ncbi:lysine-specific demethylase 2A [Rhincodon typus]|uniref:lysine-specific demethylase 2A n=1 Tax=Rhincodon typus TaxID=259920 RepID=UPI002030BB2E|nr:lysine-specific demethylase 2A [Rhincodon typus]
MEPEAEPECRSRRLRAVTRRRYEDDGISDDEIEGKRTFDLEEKLESSMYSASFVRFMDGKDFTFQYVQRDGLRCPLIFKKKDGLGIKMPEPDFSVNDVKMFVGSRRMVDVMDVNTQKGIEMTMAQWVKYYETPAAEREKLYNVISLEFSHTKLENIVQRPATVDLVDWVDNIWPRHLKERQTESTNAIVEMKYPKVRKYCLMSVRGCYTDFHIDFGGTSVWYHIHRGGKIFWLIPPTPLNLEIYESWVLSGKQGDIFLGDKVEKCQRIELKQGYTFLIPSGWIHAVYTPEDTLVFGGNFLHSFNIPTQLRIHNIEDRTRVPSKFRYPFYYEMCWYVVERYVFFLTKCSHLTKQFQRESQLIDEDTESDDTENGDDVKEEVDESEEPTERERRGHSLRKGPSESPAPDRNGLPQDHGSRLLKRSPSSESLDSGGGSLGSQDTAPAHWIHLTQFERTGLQALVDKLQSLPEHKKCVPAGLLDPDSLLQEMQKVLEDHMNDDPQLACSGLPIIRWPKRRDKPKAPIRLKPRPPVLALSKPALLKPLPGSRRRRTRCKRCEACRRSECGVCHYCRDMKKFGGPGRMKQSCVLRQCEAPILPHTALCMICEEVGQNADGENNSVRGTLMECSACSEIVHPGCLKMNISLGIISKELPNCWECPKCVRQERRKLALAKKGYSPKDGTDSERQQLIAEAVRKREEQSRRAQAIEAARRRLDALPKRKKFDYLLLRKKRLAAAEHNARKKIKFEREQILLRTKRKAEDSLDHRVGAKILRPLRNGEDLSLGPYPRLGSSRDGLRPDRAERFYRRQLRRSLDPARSNPSSAMSRHRHLSEIEKAKIRGSLLTVRLHRSPGDFNGSASHHRSPSTSLRQAPRVVSWQSGCQCQQDNPSPSSSSSDNPPDDHMMQRHLWMSVFRYLTQKELCVCMRVCKAWSKWCCDKRLWTKINLSRCKSITPLALGGISKRLPVSLDLSWSNISRKQLTWLIDRLPGLKDLFLSGCSWSAISALSTSSCPLLRTLDLRWAEGLRDSQMRDLLCTPDKPGQLDNRSKLRNVTDFRLAGLDISDVTLRLIIRHMPLLSRLDLSHCSHLSDHSLNLLTAVGSSTRNSLSELQLEGCNKLTDQCLNYLKRIGNISCINLHNCKQISKGACEMLLSELSVNGLFCLSEERQIRKIS